GEVPRHAADLFVGLAEALDRGPVPLAKVVPGGIGRADDDRQDLGQLGRIWLVGNGGRRIPDVASDHPAAGLRFDDAIRLAVQDVDGQGRDLRRVDHHLVVQDRARGDGTHVVDEGEGWVAAPTHWPRGPEAHRHLDHIAGLELWPADIWASLTL